MSWLSQFLGIDAQAAQEDAINRQQEQQRGQMDWAKNEYGNVYNRMEESMSGYGTAAGKEAQYLTDLGGGLDEWGRSSMATLDTTGEEMRTEFRGALEDIYSEGRNQAARSGLIGGFQEGQNTAPAIAALGRSYATNLATMKQNIASQKIGISKDVLSGKIGLGQQASSLRLSPYTMKNQTYGNLVPALAGLYGGASSGYGQSLGNYAEPANPLGNAIGGIAGIASIFL